MRIRDVMLTEAARFGNKEKNLLMPHLNRFKIGCEYEFNIYEGVPYLDKLIRHDDPLDIPFVKNNLRQIERLGKGISKLFDLGADVSLSDYSQDIKDALFGDVTDILTDTTMLEVAEMCMWFTSNIRKSSIDIDNEYQGTVLYRYGLLSSNFPTKELNAISRASEYAPDDEITPQLLMVFKTAIEGLQLYFREHLRGFVGKSKDYYDIVDEFNEQALQEVIESSKQPSKVDVVARDLPIDPKFIESVTSDVTVPNGAEVVTKPLGVREAFHVMDDIFEYIKDVGYTNDQTGLHVNVSISGVDLRTVNLVKMMILLDVEFMQGLTKTAKEFIKYPVRSSFVSPNTKILRMQDADGYLGVERVARAYLRGGSDMMIDEFEKLILADNRKERAVNLINVFNADVNQRRIEFRLFGPSENNGYEDRGDEIQNDILQICYVLLASTDENFLRTEYLRGIIRTLDRNVQAVEIDGMRFASFSSLINSMKNS